MNKKNVLLIDDHPLVNYGLASCLEETGRFHVCGQATTLAGAAKYLKSPLPHLIILDIMLGEENGLDFIPSLKNFCREENISPPPVLVCSVIEDDFRIRTALHMGAAGYIAKSSAKSRLLAAIDTVLRGETYVPPGINKKLEEASAALARFTKREQELLLLIKQNKTNQHIAQTLGLSLRTVENYISNIYFKTGASTRQELMKL
ncbi:DNA-binding response regulator [Treponema sp. R8-4-B8]